MSWHRDSWRCRPPPISGDFFIENPEDLTRLLENEILTQVKEPIALILDEVDILMQSPEGDLFMGMLSDWVWRRGNGRRREWRAFSVALGVSTASYDETVDRLSGVGEVVRLRPFNLEQCSELNRRLGHPLAERDVERLWRFLGGTPFLMHVAYDALRTKHHWNVDDLLAHEGGPQAFEGFTDYLSSLIVHSTERVGAIRQILDSGTLEDGPVLRWLDVNEICRKRGDRVEFTCELYERLFRRELLQTARV